LTLFGTVIILIVVIHLNKWKLDRKLGVILMAVYVFFVLLASFYESNLFGTNHLPMCLDSLW
jgi:sodium/potassium/calcium exchanger 4